MQIPKDVNTRAEAMWRIISPEVDFRNKRVIDLGCGTGDFLWRAYKASAKQVRGVDIDMSRCNVVTYWEGEFPDSEVKIIADEPTDINILVRLKSVFQPIYNIAMCFSVLPYLDDIPATLRWMSHNFALCLIEAQYEPEPYNIGVASDSGMASLLTSNGFDHVKPLGFTYVEIRDAKRTIWLCSKESE